MVSSKANNTIVMHMILRDMLGTVKIFENESYRKTGINDKRH